ncbi:hypothetical protein FRC00_011524 [Tulasnella sp. 408]|nr:hypothetical protein FRC00_011524 [Tulasnella sp. 408]
MVELTLSSMYHSWSPKDRHDDTSKDWYFVKDFELEYKDWTGVTKALPSTMPSKSAIFVKPRGKVARALSMLALIFDWR